MDPITLAALGAAFGLAKSEMVDRPNEQRDRKLQSEITRYSPWTGLSPHSVKNADPLGNAMQGGFTGYSLGANKAAGDALKNPGVSSAPSSGGVPGYGLGMDTYKPVTYDGMYPWMGLKPN